MSSMTRHPSTSHSTTKSSTSSDDVNPFDNSRTYSTDDSIISAPKPAVYSPSRHQRMAIARSGDEVLGVKQEHELDEKQWTQRHKHEAPVNKTNGYDPEKAVHTSPRTSQPRFSNDALSIAHSDDSASDLEGLQARKALNILLYLSGPCVLLSFCTMIWAVFSLLITILCQPLRLYTARLTIRHQLCHYLAPTLNLHLRCIYAPVFSRPVEEEELYCPFWLLSIHLLAPILSLGNAIAAWVVALYWGLARIVGDPSGIDKKDDGIEAVLGLTRWWERCLMKAVKLT